MPTKLDILEPGCCCVRRHPVYPEVHLMENSIIMTFFAVCAVISAQIGNSNGILLSGFTCGYGLILVCSSYVDVQRKYYERLEREEIETDGFSEAPEVPEAPEAPEVPEVPEKKDAGTETSSEEGDDARSEYSDAASQVNFDNDVSPLRRRRVIKIKKTAAAALELSQEDRVLQQLRQIEKEVAERNAAREAEAAIIVAARNAYKAVADEKKD